MMRVRHIVSKAGLHSIKIGRTTTTLMTSREADAFLAGAKLAHIQLAAEIMPILKIKDGRDD